jgi:hypothetical protein
VSAVALARIQAAEAMGAAAACIEADTSTAMPTRSGGVGVGRCWVWIQGWAVRVAPAAFCASRARAPRMLRRPGGAALAVTVAVRSR